MPVTNPRMVEKGRVLAADMVFLDMEDSVPAARRGAEARDAAVAALGGAFSAPTVGVRVNPVGSAWCLDDLREVVSRAPRLDVILVPKVEDAGQVAFVCHLLDALEDARGLPRGSVGVEVLVESAAALLDVGSIAAACPQRVEALVFGSGDFAASIDAPQAMVGQLPEPGMPDPQALALFGMVVAARAHGMQAVDSPFGGLGDLAGCELAARRARVVGCDGKWSIHPEQIPVLNRVFAATDEQIARAEAVIAAMEQGGAARAGGEMIDEATLRMAHAVLRRAARGDAGQPPG